MSVPEDVRELLVEAAKAADEQFSDRISAERHVDAVLSHFVQATYGDGAPVRWNGRSVYWIRKP